MSCSSLHVPGHKTRDITKCHAQNLTTCCGALRADVSTLSPPQLIAGGECNGKCDPWVMVWSRQLSDGAVALAVVNMNNDTSTKSTVSFRDLFCQSCSVSSASVLDIWRATTTTSHGEISVTVGPHETKLLRVTPSQVKLA